ncbi:uncharacterized protein LOC129809615 [Phlebotomus papatasi]|uniref:uncharacterized protein LOC129809615 n=1 Tax=Phlebotomus papatasi TaxID=29031 RepID=UPI002483F1AA|nr:uncharacterized protein LOC129809615 [Phlebotomus papatasi]
MAKANPETVAELKTLHRSRGAVKASLTRLELNIQDGRTLFTADLLSAYEIQLQNIIQRFEDVQQKIYTCPEVTDEDFDQECCEESTFNDRVVQVQVKISQLNRTVRRDEYPSVTTTSATEDLAKLWQQQLEINTKLVESMKTRGSNVKLPPIEIKKFTGNYSDWASFRDMYTCTIHNNDALTPVEKFKYLKGYLSGEAESEIDQLAITDENYPVAWKAIQERFEKKQNIVSTHIQSFLNISVIGEASAKSLRGMFSMSRKVIKALDALNCDQRDIWLVHILVSKLDKESVALWSRETSSSQVASLHDFFNFLEKRCDSLEMVQSQNSGKSLNKSTEKSTKNVVKQKSTLAVTQTKKCAICQQEAHQVFQCTKFINSTSTQRLDLLRKAKLCINCIRGTHSVESCQSSSCRRCNMRHNTLLHEAFHTPQSQSGDTAAPSTSSASDNSQSNGAIPKANGNAAVPQPQTTAVIQSDTVSTTLMTRPSTVHQSVLPTVSLFLIDNNGKRHKCRGLLDSCSQANLITKRLVDKCGIPTYIKPAHSISGIGSQSTKVTQAVMATINSRNHTFATKCEFLLMENITDDQPVSDINLEWKIPNDVFLADPDFAKPGKIDMLLGVDIFTQVIRAGRVEGNPTLLETALGYVVAGSFTSGGDMLNCSCLCSTQTPDTLHHAIEKFWMIEEPSSIKSSPKSEEGECEKHFAHHVTRDGSGRYIVKLPIKENVTQLGESRDSALKRFRCIERRLQRDPAIKEQYTAFMKEYEDLGHMRKLPGHYESDKPAVYLPHHPVMKLSSSSTPVRVVFDASARTSSGIALNDVLMVGPKIQDDIFCILLRFRQHPIAIKADIRKMFRQIRVADEDQNLQRIFWRDSPDKPIETYLLSTVTYGTASASFLSTRCIQQLAIDEGDSLPLAKEATMSDFYVDDFLSGGSSIPAVQELRQQMTELMSRGGFHLTKWMASDSAALTGVPEEDCEMNTHDKLGGENTTKALGIKWDTSRDDFTFKAAPYTDKVTMRNLLSEISKIYDPLGFLTPVVVRAKILMQDIWSIEADWDDDLSDHPDIVNRWTNYQKSMPDVAEITIPRRLTSLEHPAECHLLVFCDASEKAFGACIYVKTIDEDGNSTCQLLCAKSKVAPRKEVTLPRLELCGAVLAMKLLQAVQKSLTIKVDSITAFTDSTIVLHWLAGEPQRWKKFVAHRVKEVQEQLPREHWYHVPSKLNPADICSRGTTPKELANNNLWWTGPDLSQILDKQPDVFMETSDERLEQRKTFAVSLGQHSTNVSNSENFWDILERFSSHSRMLRYLTYWRRYFQNLKAKVDKSPLDFSALRVEEIQKTNQHIIRAIQKQSFPSEYKSLQEGKQVPRQSRVAKLNPFLDDSQMIRVGGRIQASNLTVEQKHPILLPPKHHLTRLISDMTHLQTCHGGPHMILATMRQMYWPLRGLDVAKATVRQCIRCFRCNPKAAHQIMGNLPPARVQFSRPFQRVGIDFCGPFQIKLPLRGGRSTKMYVCVFICFISRAIHLELVSDLSTEAFLASFKRFIARRGKPTDVFCDNGKNFVGASSHLADVQQFLSEKTTRHIITKNAADDNISFHFIPPRSPHFGGLWESAVKAFKRHFYRVIGNERLTQEAFTTVLAEIEMCLNSRPLMPQSDDPSDLEVVTPGHFLIGQSLNTLPAHDVSNVPKNRLRVWRQLDQIRQHFWSRWSREILTNMQVRSKWQFPQENVNIGDLVLLIEDNLPPLAWITGRITETHQGKDGKIRVVNVQTSSGNYMRAITKIALFPKENNPEVDTSALGNMS